MTSDGGSFSEFLMISDGWSFSEFLMISIGGHFQNFDKAKNSSSKKYYTICDVIGNEKTPRHFGIHTQLQQYRYRDGVRSRVHG